MAKKTMEDIVAQIEGDIQNRELRTKKRTRRMLVKLVIALASKLALVIVIKRFCVIR